jgi:hypothetical protein
MLCEANAMLELRDSQYGMTAFLLACENGCVDAVKALAECGADIHAKDEEGSDAKSLAEADGHQEVLKLLGMLQKEAKSAAAKRKRNAVQADDSSDDDEGEEELGDSDTSSEEDEEDAQDESDSNDDDDDDEEDDDDDEEDDEDDEEDDEEGEDDDDGEDSADGDDDSGEQEEQQGVRWRPNFASPNAVSTVAAGECPMCVKGSGKPVGHKGRHLTAKVKPARQAAAVKVKPARQAAAVKAAARGGSSSSSGECPLCARGSGKPVGHKGRHLVKIK